MAEAQKRKTEVDNLSELVKVECSEVKKNKDNEEASIMRENSQYTQMKFDMDRVAVAINDDFSNSVCNCDVGGFLVFQEKNSLRPISTLYVNRLEKAVMKSRMQNGKLSRYDRTIRSPFNMATKPKDTSRYAPPSVNFNISPFDNMCFAIKKFNDNFNYILKKSAYPTHPDVNAKHKAHVDIGIFDPISYTEVFNGVAISQDLMQQVALQHISFIRSKSTAYMKFARKTMASIEKAVCELINIAKDYFDNETVEAIYNYVGDEKPTYQHTEKFDPNFEIHFVDGFFAEGKTTQMGAGGIAEFEAFIRGKVSFLDDVDPEMSTLLTIKLEDKSQEEKKEYRMMVNEFLNSACYVMQAYKLYYILRCRVTSEILIDRSPFSRTYFKLKASGEKMVSVDTLKWNLLAPLCLYYDAVQSLFSSPLNENVYCVFKTFFMINTMIDVAHQPLKAPSRNWRNQPSRFFERELFGRYDAEKGARVQAYMLICHQLTSACNFICDGLILYSRKEKGQDKFLLTQLPSFKWVVAKLIPDNSSDLVIKSDFVHTEVFQSLLNSVYNKAIIRFDDVAGEVEREADISQDELQALVDSASALEKEEDEKSLN